MLRVGSILGLFVDAEVVGYGSFFPQRRLSLKVLHGDVSQIIELFTTTAARTSYSAYYKNVVYYTY
jgi:hypothetical protein